MIFTWGEVYFPSLWIWAGHVIYLTNRLSQKWHLVTTGLRPWKILQFHNHPLEVSYHVKKSELSCWRGQWREGGPVGWEAPIVVHLLSRVWLFATPWTAALQPSLSFTISQSLLRFMSTESVMASNQTISFSAALFSFCLQSFPASGPYPVNQLLASGSQSIEASTSVSILPMIFSIDFL